MAVTDGPLLCSTEEVNSGIILPAILCKREAIADSVLTYQNILLLLRNLPVESAGSILCWYILLSETQLRLNQSVLIYHVVRSACLA